jgi:hypothetical protein
MAPFSSRIEFTLSGQCMLRCVLLGLRPISQDGIRVRGIPLASDGHHLGEARWQNSFTNTLHR